MEDPEDGPIKFINPSASTSAEDTEIICLSAEDSENSENIDPNVQAEKNPLLSMEIWICAYCDEKNKSYQYFCSTCMSLKPKESNSKSAQKSQVRKRTLSDKEQPPVKKSNVTMASNTSEHSVIDLAEVGLGAEDSANSENIDPNVQTEKKSASLSRPLSSASNWASKETAKSGIYCLAISYS
jgi:hypothetical protein